MPLLPACACPACRAYVKYAFRPMAGQMAMGRLPSSPMSTWLITQAAMRVGGVVQGRSGGGASAHQPEQLPQPRQHVCKALKPRLRSARTRGGGADEARTQRLDAGLAGLVLEGGRHRRQALAVHHAHACARGAAVDGGGCSSPAGVTLVGVRCPERRGARSGRPILAGSSHRRCW